MFSKYANCRWNHSIIFTVLLFFPAKMFGAVEEEVFTPERVCVVLWTEKPTGEPIMFVSSTANPHFAPEGYTCCFPGGMRDVETWEYNAARLFNAQTYYYFAKMVEGPGALHTHYDLLDEDAYVRARYKEEANKRLAEVLENHAIFVKKNERAGLFFLKIPYDLFDKIYFSEFILNQRKEVLEKFPSGIDVMDRSIRPGKYFKWVLFPENTENCSELSLAFEDDVVPDDLCLKLSPYEVRWSESDVKDVLGLE